jgi:glycosyltransferase involved in cell wall biosynthesis
VLYAIKRSKIPIVLTVHNFRFFCPSGTLFNKDKVYTKSIGTNFPWQAVKDRVYNGYVISTFLVAFTFWLHKRLKSWNKIDTLIFLNEYAKNLFDKTNPILYSNKTVVKANATGYSNVLAIQRDDSFIFVGRLSAEKGILFLLKAFSACSATLKIIGDGVLKPKVKATIEENPNIVYLGYQNKDYIVEQLSKCGALVLGSGCMEMAPLTAIEAMACGTPVIAPDIETLHSIIIDGYNGLYYKFNDIHSLRQVIKDYLHLPEVDKSRISTNAKKYYEDNFTEDSSFRLGKEIYQDLVKGNRINENASPEMERITKHKTDR